MKFLDEINVQKLKYEEIKKYEGKRALIMSFKIDMDESHAHIRRRTDKLFFEEVIILSVTENLEIKLMTSDNKEITIPYKDYQEALILNVEKLIEVLNTFFIENKMILISNTDEFNAISCLDNCNSVEHFKFERFFYEIKGSLYPDTEVVEKNYFNVTTDYKKEVSTKRPFIINFDKDTKSIGLSIVTGSYANGLVIDSKNVDLDDYLNGCFYGLCELNKMIEDISDYYKDYFKSVDLARLELDKKIQELEDYSDALLKHVSGFIDMSKLGVESNNNKEIHKETREEESIFTKFKKLLLFNKKEA